MLLVFLGRLNKCKYLMDKRVISKKQKSMTFFKTNAFLNIKIDAETIIIRVKIVV